MQSTFLLYGDALAAETDGEPPEAALTGVAATDEGNRPAPAQTDHGVQKQ